MTKKVYVIRAGEYTKIGISKLPVRRVNEIQPANPLKCELRNEITSGYSAEGLEGRIHSHYFPHIAEGGREWFRIPDDEYEILEEVDHLQRSEVDELFPSRVPGRLQATGTLYKADYNHYAIRNDGREQCVSCGEVFGGEDAEMEEVHAFGPVARVGMRGEREFNAVDDSDPGDPLMHPECYEDWYPR